MRHALSVAILDANQKLDEQDETFTEIVSVVGWWLKYEADKIGLVLEHPARADVVLVVHSGEVDWKAHCLKALASVGIDPDPARRKAYLIAGGAVDCAPLTALSICDALAIGEAYTFVRQLFGMVQRGDGLDDIRAWVVEYPHAIERSQVQYLERDKHRPYMLAQAAPTLATPDEYVDWGDMPSTVSDDGVTRLLASKGCHLKCQFCATTYRQTYRVHDKPEQLVEVMRRAKAEKARVALITNDAAALDFYGDIVRQGQLAFQSVTVKALRDPHVLDTITSTRLKMLRFGVEGVSERIRRAVGKYVANDEVLAILARLRQAKQDAHLFFIAGLPYENQYDWMEVDHLLHQLQTQADSYRVRLKFTAFNPQAPTPLAYFFTNDDYFDLSTKTRERFKSRWHNPHVQFIPPRRPPNRLRDLGDMYGVTPMRLREFMPRSGETTDIAPTLDDARRMPWEVVGWPLDVSRRWRLSRSYQKQMTTAS